MLHQYCKNKKYILVYLRSAFHINMFRNLFKCPDFEFLIFSPFISVNEYKCSELAELPNCTFCDHFTPVLPKLAAFGLCLTTEALATIAHKTGLRLIRLCRACGIPVAELQHGLFTYGMSYYSSNKIMENDAIPCRSFNDYTLTFYPVEGEEYVCMGYPEHDGKKTATYRGEYNLILSNLHWTTYTNDERYQFYRAIVQLAASRPDELFIWQLHPSEKTFKQWRSISAGLFRLFPAAKQNLITTHSSAMLNLLETEHLIRKAKRVIASVSTILLDCELSGKETLVYSCPSCEQMVNLFPCKTTFSNFEQLSAVFDSPAPFSTGLLHPYNHRAFTDFVHQVYHEPEDPMLVLNCLGDI